MWRRMTYRVVVVTRAGALRDRVCAALEARGAVTCRDLDQALEEGPVDAVLVELDPSPRKSGLGVLLAATARVPHARRVLLVEGRASIADAAHAAGVCDHVLLGLAPSRVDAIADWLVPTARRAAGPSLMS